MKLSCQSVSTSEADDEMFQVLFEIARDDEDGPYLLLQRAFLEEDDGEDDPCYVETNEEHLIGYYPNLRAELTRNRLTLNLPPPATETIEVNFQITNPEFQEVRRMLTIVLHQDFK